MQSLEFYKLKAWQGILEDVVREYPTSSVSNVLAQIKARIKAIERTNKENKNG